MEVLIEFLLQPYQLTLKIIQGSFLNAEMTKGATYTIYTSPKKASTLQYL
jgi:hypothetical protein